MLALLHSIVDIEKGMKSIFSCHYVEYGRFSLMIVHVPPIVSHSYTNVSEELGLLKATT